MSFLGSLFDPVGAVATGGNNNTFDSVFSPGDNLFGDNGLGFEPSWQTNFTDSYATPAGNFADNVMDVNEDQLKNLGNHFKSNPMQMVTGVDPASTSFWNKVSGTNNNPWVTQMGGETAKDYQNSASRGINTEDGQYMGTLANAVAGWYAGQGLGNLASAGYSSAFPTEATSVAADGTGAMGSSALDVQAELANPALAGSGSSQAGWSAQGLSNGPADIGAGGASVTRGVGNVAAGAGRGGANALDNNQNVFAGAARGGLNAGIGSNLDYASGVGVDNPLYKAGINGAITGGARTAMSGDTSNSGYGALVGALGGLAGKAGSYFSQPTSGDGGSSGTTNWGNLATGLGNLYMASRNNAGIQGQINGLHSLYAPGSPYAQQMQQQLDRQDAAGGRRSQYGTRAVELQGRLADAATRNAPTLSNLFMQQRQNRFNQLAGGLAMARNSGAFNSLGGMFSNQGGQDPMSYVNQPADMPQYGGTQGNVMSTVPPMIDPDQIYGGNG